MYERPVYQDFPGMTLERLRQLLSYNPKTGNLAWRVRRARTVKTDLLAGTIDGDPRFDENGVKIDYSHQGGPRRSGHVLVTLYGQKIPAQRLAWFMTYGKWPAERLVCKDGDPENLCIDNWAPLSQTVKSDSKHANARARAKRWRDKRDAPENNPNRAAYLNEAQHDLVASRAHRLKRDMERDPFRTGPHQVARVKYDAAGTPRRSTRRTTKE